MLLADNAQTFGLAIISPAWNVDTLLKNGRQQRDVCVCVCVCVCERERKREIHCQKAKCQIISSVYEMLQCVCVLYVRCVCLSNVYISGLSFSHAVLKLGF